MSRAHAITLGLFLCSNVALANGGGYSFGVTFTGAVAPFQASGTEHVRITNETLSIDLHSTDASVTVRYVMKNVTDRPVTVRFGFPVEATPRGWEDGLDGEALTFAQRRHNVVKGIQQLRGYAVTADGATVKATFELEPFAEGKLKAFPGSEALANIAGWMVSQVSFPASGGRAIEIHYKADYMGDVTYVSDDEQMSPLELVYRLSTGAVWNGTIAEGTVTVRADGVVADEVEIVAPRERFRREGDRWLWSFHDLEPTLADDITIRAVPGYYELGFVYDQALRAKGVRSYLERGGAWGEGHQRFAAHASSTLPRNEAHDFGAQHLAEPYSDSAVPWSEGVPGTGIGEWVDLEPARPAPLLALEITPGFASTEKPALFTANGRPARVEILLNDEHRFEATLADRPDAQIIPIVGYTKPVSRVRITIREVYPGTRYQDTCISRVVLYDKLAAKPPVSPAR